MSDTTESLHWLAEDLQAALAQAPVARQYLGPSLGFGLVARGDLAPGETILSLPMPSCITSEGADESRWSLLMAARLLAAAAGGAHARWAARLPRHVPLPWLHWSEPELAELQDEGALAEARHLRAMFDGECQAAATDPAGRQALAWALSVVHSRSFVQQQGAGGGLLHLVAPGIDFANHSWRPSATIRCVHSPGACQGREAVEEVCPPAADGSGEPSRFELVAGGEGVAAGQEVTISYGRWPSDVLLLFFGWVPEDNPHEAVVLFEGLPDLAAFGAGLLGGGPQREEALLGALRAALGPDAEHSRLVATAKGLDGRLLQAVGALLDAVATLPMEQPPPPALCGAAELLRARCTALLESFPSSLEEDERCLAAAAAAAAAAGASAGALSDGSPLLTALRFRLGKKRLLALVHSSLPASHRIS